MTKKRLYKVIFINQGKAYEIYAKRVNQDSMYGFIAIDGIVFGEKSSVVVDPAEERLKSEFDGVRMTHIPVHAVIRIDEVEKQGVAKIIPLGKNDNVTAFPGQFGHPPKKGELD